MYYSQTRACLCRSMCPIYSEKPWHWLPKKRRTLNWAKQEWRGLAMCFLGIGSGSVSYRMVHDMVCSWFVFFRAISKQATWTITSIGWPKSAVVGRDVAFTARCWSEGWSGSSKRMIQKIWILQWILRNERCSGFEQS